MDRALILQRSGMHSRDNGKDDSKSKGSKDGDKDGNGKSSNESSNKSSSTSHSPSTTSSRTAKATSAAAKATFAPITTINSQGDCIPMNSNPFAGTPFAGNPFAVGVINDNNPLLNYSTGWSIASVNPNGNLTNHFTRTAGSQVSFTFIGTDIRVVGIIPPSNATAPAPVAAYTIDGGPPETIPLPQSTQCLYGQTFFLASNLTSPTGGSATGQHTLDIHVLDAKSPYILDYIVFSKAPNSQDDTNKNGTATGSGKSGNPSPSALSSHTPTTTKPGMSFTAIVSVILGVFALIIAIIALILLHRRRWRRLQAQRQVEDSMEQGGWQTMDKTSDIMKWTSTESILRDVRSQGYAPSSFGSSQSQQTREGTAYAPYASPVKDRSLTFASNPSLSPGVSAPSKGHSRSASRNEEGGRPMSAPPPIIIYSEEV